jgi:hypothetical protein
MSTKNMDVLAGRVLDSGANEQLSGQVRTVGRHTAAVRLTDFWSRMRQHFGPTYAESFAHDFVLGELGGRTIDEALAQGVDVQEIWRAVCRTVDVAPKLR